MKLKNWNELNEQQKRNTLVGAIKCSSVAFWKFTGKDNQRKYFTILTDKTIDTDFDRLRMEIYNTYLSINPNDQHKKNIEKKLLIKGETK